MVRWRQTMVLRYMAPVFLLVAVAGAPRAVAAPPATSCDTTDQCTPGETCVDGYCCDEACGGGDPGDCRACDLPGSEGVCTSLAAGEACADDGELCSRDVCDAAGSCTHPAGNPGTLCREASGECDTPEYCNGVFATCPLDGVLPVGAPCTDDGEICSLDECDGGGECVHPAGNAGETCRGSVGECDPPESCDGETPSCPDDTFLSAGTLCTDDGEACTLDQCDGAGACAHPPGNAGVECRVGTGQCDPAELCDGIAGTCPEDAYLPEGEPCGDDGQACTVDACTGTGFCAHKPGNPGATCRPSTGECDPAEVCDGLAPWCPGDAYADAGLPCADDGEICTIDQCDGLGSCAHPAGNAGAVCREAAGECDVEETCNGTLDACPADDFVEEGTPCTDDGEICSADQCDGLGACAHVPTNEGLECRASAGICDAAEQCDGASPACPDDQPVEDGTSCADGITCNGTETCQQGVCETAPLDCDDGDLCTADSCVEPDGCAYDVDPDCCNTDTDCDDGDPCTADSCSGPGGDCSHEPVFGCCELDDECDDGAACTTDICDLGVNRCAHLPVDACCASIDDCEDGDLCTVDACDTETGRCSREHTPLCCTIDAECAADAPSCTEPSCDLANNRCQFPATVGCCAADGDCVDSDACTTDTCDTDTGQCSYLAIAGCCYDDASCDDGDPCTDQKCSGLGGTCSYTELGGCCNADGDCDDELDCTADTCDLETNTCDNVAIPNCCLLDEDCDDEDACTHDACDPVARECVWLPYAGCCNSDAECADIDPCTDDTCTGPGGSCLHSAVEGCCNSDVDCNDTDICTQDLCDLGVNTCFFFPVAGCCSANADCDDGDPCTTDRCDPTTRRCGARPIAGCCNAAEDCDDEDICTVERCPGRGEQCVWDPVEGCCHAAEDCDDGDECTIDLCDETNTCTTEPDPACAPEPEPDEVEAGPELSPDAADEDTAPPDHAGLRADGGGCQCRGAASPGVTFFLSALLVLGFGVLRRRRFSCRRAS